MKKLFLFASAAGLLAASCSDDLSLRDNTESTLPLKGNTILYASYPMGEDVDTRTTLENNAAKSYVWNTGDAVGVYGVNSNIVSIFSYVQGTTGQPSIFTGDVDALYGDQFYGYYPYNGKPAIGENTIVMTINASQNFNHKAEAEVSVINPPTGSFANGEAPAVAIGNLKEGTETPYELSMTFYPLATYLVFPVSAYEKVNIQKLVLTIGDEVLAGDMTVNLKPLLDGEKLAPVGPTTNTSKEITLYCGGNGVTLEAGEATNFWFVVPATTNLKNAKINVDVFADNNTTETPSYTMTKTLGSNAPEVSGANAWYVVTPSAGERWVYNPQNAYLITNQYQFLEYAYLVSNGISTAFDQYYDLKNKNYSDLENMVTGVYGTNYTDGKVKPALIYGEIPFNWEEVKTWLGVAGTGSYKDDLAPYYQSVYGGFIDSEGYINTIGGKEGFTMTGINEASLNGLKINGNGMFIAGNGSVNVNDVTLENILVDAGTANPAYFLGNPSNQNFTDVTVENTCDMNVADGVNKVLFNELRTSWIKSYNNVVNKSSMKFANILNDDNQFKYDFNVLPGIDQFNKIEVTVKDGAIFVIPDGNTISNYAAAQSFMDKVDNIYNNKPLGYSVIDSKTSYWTGTIYGLYPSATPNPEMTAEQFAYWVQAWPEANNKMVELNLDLNLMNKNWWNNGGKNRQVEGNNHYIYNIYMDGYKLDGTEAPAAGNLTLLGQGSYVNALNIYTMNIDNKRDWETYIAAISTYPNTASYGSDLLNNVSVDNFHIVTNVALNNAVGGLYSYINWDWYVKIAPSVICNFGVKSENEDLVSGPIAGLMIYNSEGADVLVWKNISSNYANPFGRSDITIDGADESTTTFVLSGENEFNLDFIKGLNFIVGDNVKLNYTVFVNNLTVAPATYYYWMAKQLPSLELFFQYQGTRTPGTQPMSLVK